MLLNQGIKDFRDPKVSWHEASQKWVMILAVWDHVELYGSPDLKSWNKLSDFGLEHGNHGGVWECPDLFELPIEGSDESRWVMFVSIGRGGPNKGSVTQYFIGQFDGQQFTNENSKQTELWGRCRSRQLCRCNMVRYSQRRRPEIVYRLDEQLGICPGSSHRKMAQRHDRS